MSQRYWVSLFVADIGESPPYYIGGRGCFADSETYLAVITNRGFCLSFLNAVIQSHKVETKWKRKIARIVGNIGIAQKTCKSNALSIRPRREIDVGCIRITLEFLIG